MNETSPCPQYGPLQSSGSEQQPASDSPKPAFRISIKALVIFSVILALAGVAAALAFALAPYAAGPADLNGTWSFSVTLAHISNDNYVTAGKVGDTETAAMDIYLDSSGNGTLYVYYPYSSGESSPGTDGMTYDAAYKGGRLTASRTIQGNLEHSLEGMLKKTDNGFEFSGTWKLSVTEGTDKGEASRGTWSASLSR